MELLTWKLKTFNYMDQYLSFLNSDYEEALGRLYADQSSLWGEMSAQRMVEHLILAVRCSNGKIHLEPNGDLDKLATRKLRLFEKDVLWPHNFKVEWATKANLEPYEFDSLGESKKGLIKEVKDFFAYFREEPNAQTTSPQFGSLNFKEWVQMHARHFRHHFQQFGLMKETLEFELMN
jgi:hypothetical protein